MDLKREIYKRIDISLEMPNLICGGRYFQNEMLLPCQSVDLNSFIFVTLKLRWELPGSISKGLELNMGLVNEGTSFKDFVQGKSFALDKTYHPLNMPSHYIVE